jgi:5-bromo-4-chloroindolyl phosphate hydrolysis protein
LDAGLPANRLSCTTCHDLSSVKSDGTDSITLLQALPADPIGFPQPLPSKDWIRRDFVWSLLLAQTLRAQLDGGRRGGGSPGADTRGRGRASLRAGVRCGSAGGLVLLLAPGTPFKALDASGVAKGKIAFARELLTAADPSVQRLESAAKAIRAKTAAERVRHLASVARGIFEAIEKDPLRIDRVRRFLTYYLPRAAEMAEAYQSLEGGPRAEAARLTATGEIIDRLDAAFTEYAANLHLAELDKLDIELKLLKRSLDEDLGSTAALDTAPQRSA